ncbi:MAG: hypothetical protein KKD63_12145, partial [Proteobacteria bacterium]|nr:hypothetical protein [Pseudomonadota bacterium]
EKEALQFQVQQIDELKIELAAREEEIGSLREAGERERSESGSVVSSLQAALQEIEARAKAFQQEKEALQIQLQQVDLLTAELAAREEEIKSLGEAGERERCESESVVLSIQSTLQILEVRIAELQKEKEALQIKLQQGDELQVELVAREEEIKALREAGERQREEVAAHNRLMEANLSEVVLARQVEITHLNIALKIAEDKVLAERELADELSRGVDALKEELRQALGRESASEQQARFYEQKLVALNEENRKQKVKVTEGSEKSTGGDGVVSIKGVSSLPDDVLLKWMSKG